MTRSILVWTNTPDNIIDLADIYIRTIFIGIPFTLLYNMTSACLLYTSVFVSVILMRLSGAFLLNCELFALTPVSYTHLSLPSPRARPMRWISPAGT